MAEDTNIDTVETTTHTEAVPPKKRRGPEAKNVAAEATSESLKAEAAKAGSGRGKNVAKSVEKVASVEAVGRPTAKKPVKGAAKTRTPKQATTEAPSALDDIADLLQLEEENARLRKTLAEKLRAENADLRKRLGLA